MVTEEPFVVRVPQAIYNEMVERVLAGYPDEACGALGSQDGVVVKHYPTANVAEHPDDYSEISSDDKMRIFNDTDKYDWGTIYYHSHPLSEAYPSPRDIEVARANDYLYIIFSLRFHPEPPDARVFSIDLRTGAVTEGKIAII